MRRILLTVCAAALALPVAAQDAPVYATPQDALDAFVAALGTGDLDAVLAAIDPAAEDMIRDPEDPGNTAVMEDLLDLYREGWRFVPREDEGVTIELGEEDWPFPVPLARAGDGWIFDIEEARDEVRARDIGLNELEVLEAMAAYVEIQAEYRQQDHDGDGVLEFAASVISSPGTRDGLYWDGDDSPIGDIAARASLDGFGEEEGGEDHEPLSGYYFRILTSQGPSAPGGEMDYMVNGNMLAGHALLAVPAEYDVTGIHSFMVSEAGVIYEADLGDDTADLGFAITRFDPGEGWTPVEDAPVE